MIIEELLTLGDRDTYYASGLQPGQFGERPPEKFSPDLNKAHDNIRRLVRDYDILLGNQIKLRKALRKVIGWSAFAVFAAWSPLWLPLLMKAAGLK